MKRLLTLSALLLLSPLAQAQCNAAFGSPCSDNTTALAGAAAGAGAAAVLNYAPNEAPAAKIPDPAAMAPNPHAAPPSASCWIGASVTAAISEFGIGVSGMEWDPICGLWLAAQQVAGEPQKEAATAAYCMTMKKAKVQSVSCVDWDNDQTLMANLIGLDPDNRASVSFQGSGSTGWGR